MTYHIGTLQGRRKTTLILQARQILDMLDCEIYDYWGKVETTKKELRQKKFRYLAHFQQISPKLYNRFTHIIID